MALKTKALPGAVLMELVAGHAIVGVIPVARQVGIRVGADRCVRRWISFGIILQGISKIWGPNCCAIPGPPAMHISRSFWTSVVRGRGFLMSMPAGHCRR